VTLLVGPVVPVPVPQIVLDALTSIEVTSSTGRPSGFQLAFTVSNRSLLHTFLLIAGAEAPLLRVLLVVTVNGLPQVLMDGVTTHQQVAPGARPGESTLTVTGEDLSQVMDRQDLSGLPYPAMTMEARVALIVAKYAMFGLVPVPIPPLFSDLPIPTERIPAQKGTDLAYVRQLATSVGYVFYVDPGPVPGTSLAYWGPEIKVGVPQPALNVDMDAHTNVESMSFTFDTSTSKLPIVLIQNPMSKVAIPIPIPKLNPLQPPLGAISASIANITVLKDTAKMSPMDALARGMAEASASGDAVKGTGSLDVTRYGRLLKSRQLVGVRGAGLAFDGLYFVSSVTTSLTRGECKQRFELTRNGIVPLTPVVPV
jgi:hypothetical protein